MSEGSRQTGRTSKQMLEAPRGAMFVWCNSSTWYPRDLARSLGRTDLQICGPDMLNASSLHSLRSRGGKLVLDHACDVTSSPRWDVYYWARQAGVLA
jgi:hypothetical protein